MNEKPLNRKTYGSIPHLSTSKFGGVDKIIEKGQERILTEKTRNKHDVVIVQEKLDGSNVSVAKINGEIVALTRSGYLAETSPYEMHHLFKDYVEVHKDKFDAILQEGHRINGEWMIRAHGILYDLYGDMFFPFDMFNTNNERYPFDIFICAVSKNGFITPKIISVGGAVSIKEAMQAVYHTPDYESYLLCMEKPEGAVWRIEHKGKVDFLAKYVRGDKIDGKYLGRSVMNYFRSEPVVWSKDIFKQVGI